MSEQQKITEEQELALHECCESVFKELMCAAQAPRLQISVEDRRKVLKAAMLFGNVPSEHNLENLRQACSNHLTDLHPHPGEEDRFAELVARTAATRMDTEARNANLPADVVNLKHVQQELDKRAQEEQLEQNLNRAANEKMAEDEDAEQDQLAESDKGE